MKTYIVYVQTPGEKIVYDKRFEASDYEDLQAKVIEYFKYMTNSVVVRVEEVAKIFGDINLHFGTNFISEKA